MVFVSGILDDMLLGPEHLCVLNILVKLSGYGNIDFATDKELVEIDSGSDHVTVNRRRFECLVLGSKPIPSKQNRLRC